MSNGRTFRRKILRTARVHTTAYEGMPKLFAEVWANALKQMETMRREGTTREFTVWGELSATNGQSFKVSIECRPPVTNQKPELN